MNNFLKTIVLVPIFGLLLVNGTNLLAQPKQDPKAVNSQQVSTKSDSMVVVTSHTISIAGKQISYKAKAGYMLMKEEYGKPKAKVFYIAYTLDGVADPAKRPITYCFNGGPGSSSVWLHMGTIGPRRILMKDDGTPTAVPYQLVDNEYSWLDATDLVFIDPVSTGYSQPIEGVNKGDFHGYNEDITSVGDFIRQHCSNNLRWASPKYLAGESYGTTRAAGLSGYLQDRYGMYLNGIVLVSAVLNFQTLSFEPGNELPYQLFLPTYAATAWYHKKLGSQFSDLPSLLPQVQQFAMGDYATYLLKGDNATELEHNAIATKLATYTGLTTQYLRQTNNRIKIFRFTKELLRTSGQTIGRFDSRIKASDVDNAGETYEFDPSFNYATFGPYAQAINDYLGRELKFKSDLPYELLTGKVQPWNYNNVQNRYLNVSETLRSALVKNPSLKVYVGNGYYDLATPYFATEYTFSHIFLPLAQRNNIKFGYYQGGHMMYTVKDELIKLKKEVGAWYQGQ
jgi:carboxypeptidase C (cathepsin A)